jgi:enoyl-CoA hydratase/carnithine racemase
LGKRAFYQQLEMPQAQAYQYTRDVMSGNACAQDAQEGMSAFLQKRKPTWSGK